MLGLAQRAAVARSALCDDRLAQHFCHNLLLTGIDFVVE